MDNSRKINLDSLDFCILMDFCILNHGTLQRLLCSQVKYDATIFKYGSEILHPRNEWFAVNVYIKLLFELYVGVI